MNRWVDGSAVKVCVFVRSIIFISVNPVYKQLLLHLLFFLYLSGNRVLLERSVRD